MSKMLYYTYLTISALGLVSTVVCALWWRHESIYSKNSYTPIEPVLFTLLSFAIMVYFLNKLHLFLD
jgi:O-antigen/teichoic acid export membrane protein